MLGIVSLTCVESPLHVPLDDLFVLGQVSLEFSPAPCSTIECPTSGIEKIILMVSFMVGGHPVFSKILRERYNFLVSAYIEPYTNVEFEPADDQPVEIPTQAEPVRMIQPLRLAEPRRSSAHELQPRFQHFRRTHFQPAEPTRRPLHVQPAEPVRMIQTMRIAEPLRLPSARELQLGPVRIPPELAEPVRQTEPVGQQPAEPTANISTDAVGNVALKLISHNKDIVEEVVDEKAVECSTELLDESDKLAWKVTVSALCLPNYQTLVVRYWLQSGDIVSENAEVTYTF